MSKTVFILGAGASYSHSNKEFPLVNDIFKVAKKLSVTTRINSRNTLSLDYECVEEYINEKFGKSILDSRQKLNIEDILTSLEIDIEKIRTNKLEITRIPCFIEDVYNRKRLHSALGYRPPEEYERLLTNDSSRDIEIAKTLNVSSEGCAPRIILIISTSI